jgi:hypothetical protein
VSPSTNPRSAATEVKKAARYLMSVWQEQEGIKLHIIIYGNLPSLLPVRQLFGVLARLLKKINIWNELRRLFSTQRMV